MQDYTAVTTFSPRGYALYGRRFIESFLTFWSIPLVVYYESEPPDIVHPRLILRDLDREEDRTRFLERYDREEFRGDPGDYATQAIRFCHKVFAFTSPVPPTKWCLWLDADVETVAPVTPQVLQAICPDDRALSYLGRQDMEHTETGFVGYRPDDPDVAAMLASLRRMYSSGGIFDLGPRKRNDAALFDIVRAIVPSDKQCNLASGIPGTHVWPQTPLGRVMHHWKGQARKKEAYGSVIRP